MDIAFFLSQRKEDLFGLIYFIPQGGYQCKEYGKKYFF